MADSEPQNDQIVRFLRQRDYRLVKELGAGACGKTVLLHDEDIDEFFVCKKYSPFAETHRKILFEAFVKEAKLLHQVNHRNVVRVFNYYLYPKTFTGYILMEFVDGLNIDQYASQFPEKINDIFLQAITGFRHLETAGILHRDIRPANLMLRTDGTLKIIDLGFGKAVLVSKDFKKSINLNWAYETPAEFDDDRYDFKSEVYFVGKLFDGLIHANKIKEFKYQAILAQMCERTPESRLASFSEVERRIGTNQFVETKFTEGEKEAYRNFAEALAAQITKLDVDAKYLTDTDRIATQLNENYLTFMLEKRVPDCLGVVNCFVSGAYYYKKNGLSVDVVRSFLHLLKSSDNEKNRIILANLTSRLDALPRYRQEDELKELDVPF